MSVQAIAKTIVATTGACLGYFLGGWDALAKALIALIVIDYLTGIVASYILGELKSKVGFIGIIKKVVTLCLVWAAVQVDLALNTNSAARDATIVFFIGNELLSILENAGRMGIQLPDALTNAVEVLKGKANKKGNDKDVNS